MVSPHLRQNPAVTLKRVAPPCIQTETPGACFPFSDMTNSFSDRSHGIMGDDYCAQVVLKRKTEGKRFAWSSYTIAGLLCLRSKQGPKTRNKQTEQRTSKKPLTTSQALGLPRPKKFRVLATNKTNKHWQLHCCACTC